MDLEHFRVLSSSTQIHKLSNFKVTNTSIWKFMVYVSVSWCIIPHYHFSFNFSYYVVLSVGGVTLNRFSSVRAIMNRSVSWTETGREAAASAIRRRSMNISRDLARAPLPPMKPCVCRRLRRLMMLAAECGTSSHADDAPFCSAPAPVSM